MKRKLAYINGNLYYPLSEEEYKQEIWSSIVFNIFIFSLGIWLSINYSAWWILLPLFVHYSPGKIAKREDKS